ncbi:MAG: hypothetical protein OEV78_09020 [Spirochaetia bacterium]|nr:hypothetical protein [Spirochaetia bacterium]
MEAAVLFITREISQKGLVKEIETFLRVNRNVNIRFDLVDDENEAYIKISACSHDLIILDFDALSVSPLIVLEKIKLVSKAIIMVVTGDMSEDTGILSLENGADDIQYKPLRQIEFLLKISNLIKMQVFQNRLIEEKGILKKFVSEEIADHIMSENSTNGIKTYATILFFDLRDSTAMAESISPFELADHLNEVMNHVIDIVYQNFGSVNNILGDGILATFGYPVVYDFDSLRAIRCIYQIRNLIETHKFAFPVRCGIGVTTGAMFSGNIGNSHKMTCTVLGDIVNTASRLQNLTKKAQVDSLIDQTTWQSVEKYVTVQKFKGRARGKAGWIHMYHPKKIDIEMIDMYLKSTNEMIGHNISGIGEIDFF